jgi:hypothetical protein
VGSSSRKDPTDPPLLPFGNMWYLRRRPEPSWKQRLGLYFLPALIVVLGAEYLLGASAVGIWLSFIAFSLIYLGVVLLVFRRR